MNQKYKEKYRPLFLCGCDRSGTTMLGGMLGMASNTITTPESQFLIQKYPGSTKELSLMDKDQLLSELFSHWRLKIWGINDFKSRLNKILNENNAHGFKYRDIIGAIIKLYSEDCNKTDASVWVDHTPMHIKYVNRLLAIFPNAKFIHIVRDGRAIAASFKTLKWGPNTAYSAAEWWLCKASVGSAAELKFGKKKILRVKYEHLVAKPDKILRQICNFSDLEYSDTMITGGGFSVPRYTTMQHTLVGRRPNLSQIDKWRKQLSAREVELFEYRSGDLLQYFGYELQFNGRARPPGRIEYRRLIAIEFIYGVFNTMISRLRCLRVKVGV